MVDKLNGVVPAERKTATGISRGSQNQRQGPSFGEVLEQKSAEKRAAQTINFSKHALARAEERGIELTPTLMDKLAGSVERAQVKGANTILAFDESSAFIINIPYGRVITTISQEEMKENVFTNIDGAVLL